MVTVDAGQDGERSVGVGLVTPGGQKPHEVGGLLGEADAQQRIQRECGIADPRVAIVPVSGGHPTPPGEGRRTGRCGDDRSRRVEGQQLEDESRPVDHLAPPPAVGALREPAMPIVDRSREQLALQVIRAAQVTAVRVGLAECERRLLALFEREFGDRRAAVDRERGRRSPAPVRAPASGTRRRLRQLPHGAPRGRSRRRERNASEASWCRGCLVTRRTTHRRSVVLGGFADGHVVGDLGTPEADRNRVTSTLLSGQ